MFEEKKKKFENKITNLNEDYHESPIIFDNYVESNEIVELNEEEVKLMRKKLGNI